MHRPRAQPPTHAASTLSNGAYPVRAGWSLIPSGISVSNTFRLLFIASTRWNGTSSDIADCNSFVQT